MKRRITPPPVDNRCSLYCTERICESADFGIFYTISTRRPSYS